MHDLTLVLLAFSTFDIWPKQLTINKLQLVASKLNIITRLVYNIYTLFVFIILLLPQRLHRFAKGHVWYKKPLQLILIYELEQCGNQLQADLVHHLKHLL